METNVQHNLDQNPLLSESYMINHKGDRFSVDFKGATLQHMEPSNKTMVIINHKSVVMDPWKIKEFSKNLQENISKYEQSYGEIKMPENVKKDLEAHDSTVEAKSTVSTSKKHSYFG